MKPGWRIFTDSPAIVSVIWLVYPVSCETVANQTRDAEGGEMTSLSPGAIAGIVLAVAAGVVVIGFIFMSCLRCHSLRMARRREKMIIPCSMDVDTHFQPPDFNRHSAFYDARSLGSSHSVNNATNHAAHLAAQPLPTTFAAPTSSVIPPQVNRSPRRSKVSGAVTTLLDRVTNLRRCANDSLRGPQQQQHFQSVDLSSPPSIYPSLAGFVHQNLEVEEEAVGVSTTAMPVVPAFECRQMSAAPMPACVNQETPCASLTAASIRQSQSYKNLDDASAAAAAAAAETATTTTLQSPSAVSPSFQDFSADTATAAGATPPRYSTAASSIEAPTRPSMDATGSRRRISVSVREMTRRLLAAVLRQSTDEAEEAETAEGDDVDGPQSSNIGVESSRRVFKSRAAGGGGGGGARRTGIRPSGGGGGGGGRKNSNAFGSTSSLTSSRGAGGGTMNALTVSGISERLARRKNKQAKNRQAVDEGHYNVNAIGDAAEMDELDTHLDNDHFLLSLESAVFQGIYEHHVPALAPTLYTHFDDVNTSGVAGGSSRMVTDGHFSEARLLTSASASSMLQAGDLGLLDVYGLGHFDSGYAARSSHGKQRQFAVPRRPFLPPGSPVIGFAFQQLRQQQGLDSGTDGKSMQHNEVPECREQTVDMGSISTIATVLAPSAIVHEGVNSSDTDSSSLIYQEGGSTPKHAMGTVPGPLSAPVAAPCHAPFAAATAPLPGAETRRPSLQARQLPAPVACDLRLNRHIQAAPTSPAAHKKKPEPMVAQMDSPPADSGHAGSSNAIGESEVGQPATVCDEAEDFDFHFDFTGAVEEEGAADPTLRLATFDSVDESDLGAGGSSVDSASEMLPSKPHPSVVTNRRRTLVHLRSPSMPGCALSPLLPTFSNQTAGHDITLQPPPSRRSLSATHLIPPQDELPSLEPNLPERDHRWGSRAAVETWLSEAGWRNDPSTAVVGPSCETQQPQTLLSPTVAKPVPIFLPLES